MYRYPHAAPQSQIPEERQGRQVGRFCLTCASIYPIHRGRHSGKPIYGKDHIATTCAHEGDAFDPGESWWELAVEVLPHAVADAERDLRVGAPGKGTEP
jgi:hypothetical protein